MVSKQELAVFNLLVWALYALHIHDTTTNLPDGSKQLLADAGIGTWALYLPLAFYGVVAFVLFIWAVTSENRD